jgi:hypothetical protein
MGQNAGSAINASNANFGSSAGNIKQMHINQISWVTRSDKQQMLITQISLVIILV